jgi:PIN domain nuclease of toxin-antitoxin system
LWWLDDAAELGEKSRELISRPENLVFYSAVGLWELRIKEASERSSYREIFAEGAF